MLAIRYDWREHLAADAAQLLESNDQTRFKVGAPHDELLVEVFDAHHSRSHEDGMHRIRLEPYAWRWFRVGATDNALRRSELAITDSQVK